MRRPPSAFYLSYTMSVKTQYGVIPYTNKKKSPKIILITSRTNGYWIFPKGNPMKKKTFFQSAAVEAYEEAGVRGTVNKKASYTIKFRHQNIDHKIVLFPMKIETLLDEWPERKERKRKVVSVEKALKMIELTSLQNCLKKWHHDFYPS